MFVLNGRFGRIRLHAPVPAGGGPSLGCRGSTLDSETERQWGGPTEIEPLFPATGKIRPPSASRGNRAPANPPPQGCGAGWSAAVWPPAPCGIWVPLPNRRMFVYFGDIFSKTAKKGVFWAPVRRSTPFPWPLRDPKKRDPFAFASGLLQKMDTHPPPPAFSVRVRFKTNLPLATNRRKTGSLRRLS